MSSTEVEYIAAVKASMEAFWMRKFIDGLGELLDSSWIKPYQEYELQTREHIPKRILAELLDSSRIKPYQVKFDSSSQTPCYVVVYKADLVADKAQTEYALEFVARILNMVPTKKVERTPYEIWHGKAPNKEHNEVAPTEVEPQNVRVHIRRSARIPQAQDRYGFYVDVEEHELGDLNEPPNYMAALSYLEFEKLPEAMNTEMQSMKDNQVWIFASGSSVAFLVLYVDDILLMGNNVTMLVKSWLCKCFSMKDLGETTYILGINIIRNRSKRLIALSQSAYLEKTINKFRIKKSKKGYTLMIEKPDYSKSQGAKTPSEVQRMRRVPYASARGSLSHSISIGLLSDGMTPPSPSINFLIQTASIDASVAAMYSASIEDISVVLCLALFQSTALPLTELKVSCYADVSFYTDKDDTKSQIGYVFVLNGGAVDWKSAKQSTTDMSSTEAEYITATEASMKAVWIRKFIDGLGGVMPSNKRPIDMLCDNEPTIAIADDPGILKGA
nr:hypothetical protein [Tanacetum cinerariifolium]